MFLIKMVQLPSQLHTYITKCHMSAVEMTEHYAQNYDFRIRHRQLMKENLNAKLG